MKMESRSLIMVSGKPYPLQYHPLIKASAVSFEFIFNVVGISDTSLVSLSWITSRLFFPQSDLGMSAKSIPITLNLESGIGRGVIKPDGLLWFGFILWHISQVLI